MAGRVFTSSPIRVDTGMRGRDFRRADIVFEDVDLSGPSYEARVFLNNPDADEETETIPENGYAGAFHVYGYGLWPEDLAPEDARSGGSRQPRGPITKYVMATEAVRAALGQGDEVTVTVAAVPYGESGVGLAVNLDMSQVSIWVDRSPQ